MNVSAWDYMISPACYLSETIACILLHTVTSQTITTSLVSIFPRKLQYHYLWDCYQHIQSIKINAYPHMKSIFHPLSILESFPVTNFLSNEKMEVGFAYVYQEE